MIEFGITFVRDMEAWTMNDLELLELDLATTFIHDARGRIVRNNEPDGEPAPRFLFGRTRVGNCWRVRDDVPDHIALQLEDLAAPEPVQDDLTLPPGHFGAMHEALGAHFEPGDGGYDLAYRFPEAMAEFARAIRITPGNVSLLHRIWSVEGASEGLDHGLIWTAMVVEGAAVSHCYSCRLTDRAAVAGVETLEGYRRRGYATAVTAAWAQAVRDSGRIPLYSTSWDNLASQAVARKLGLVQYAVGFGIE